jgi:hypothetical protein
MNCDDRYFDGMDWLEAEHNDMLDADDEEEQLRFLIRIHDPLKH